MVNPKANVSYRWLFWLLALVGFTADQASKYGVFAWLYDDKRLEGSFELVPGAFELVARYTNVTADGEAPLARLRTVSAGHLPQVNQGALWGTKLFFLPASANVVFGIVSVLAAVGIIYWSTRPGTAKNRLLCVALGLILAGTLGNLYDRIVFSGVRDFLWWHKGINWPVFNFADCYLVCGAGLLLMEACFTTPASKDETVEVASAASAQSAGGLY